MDYQGTISRGVRAPIIRHGDDLVKITADCVTEAAKQGGFEIQDKDVIAGYGGGSGEGAGKLRHGRSDCKRRIGKIRRSHRGACSSDFLEKSFFYDS